MGTVTVLEGGRLWLEALSLSEKDLEELRRAADFRRKTIPELVEDLVDLDMTPASFLRWRRESRNLPAVLKVRQKSRRKYEMVIAAEALSMQARMLERECEMAGAAMNPELRAVLARAVRLLSGLDDDLLGKFQRTSDEILSARRRIPLRDLAAALAGQKNPTIRSVGRPRGHRKPRLKLIVSKAQKSRGAGDA